MNSIYRDFRFHSVHVDSLKERMQEINDLVKKTTPKFQISEINKMTEAASKVTSNFTFSIPEFPVELLELGNELFEKNRRAIAELEKLDLRNALQDSLESSLLPENLREYVNKHGSETSGDELKNFILQTGVPIFAVPDAILIHSLVHCDPTEVDALLLSAKEQIIKSCETVCEYEDLATVVPETEFLKEAISVIKNDCFASSQALTTLLIDSVTCRLFIGDKERHKEIKAVSENDITALPNFLENQSEEPLHNALALLTWIPVRRAHTKFHLGQSDQIPKNYNRHASVHAVTPDQYSELNSLKALMLATSVIFYAFWEQEILETKSLLKRLVNKSDAESN